MIDEYWYKWRYGTDEEWKELKLARSIEKKRPDPTALIAFRRNPVHGDDNFDPDNPPSYEPSSDRIPNSVDRELRQLERAEIGDPED